MSNQKYDSETFITDSSAIPHVVNSEEKMTNLKDVETPVTAGDSRTITGDKRGDWYGY